jgi:putative aldouronate transport system permease protein
MAIKGNGPVGMGMVANKGPLSVVINLVLSTILLILMFCSIIPLWHVLIASMSDGKLLMAHEGVLWLPVGNTTLEGYRIIFKDSSILQGCLNTLVYVVGATVFGFFINVTGGYVLSRNSRLRPFLTLFVMFTMIFNGGLIPTYAVVRSLGMVGTRWSLLIPGCTNAIFVIMMMNAFQRVPESTVEAARIDGAGHLQVMWQVMLPQAQSMMTVVLLNSVIIQWNAWFNASIYVPSKRALWPLQLWIKQLVADNSNIMLNVNPDYNRLLVQYAVIIVATLPVLAAFPFFQKKLEAGMIMGGVKE